MGPHCMNIRWLNSADRNKSPSILCRRSHFEMCKFNVLLVDPYGVSAKTLKLLWNQVCVWVCTNECCAFSVALHWDGMCFIYWILLQSNTNNNNNRIGKQVIKMRMRSETLVRLSIVEREREKESRGPNSPTIPCVPRILYEFSNYSTLKLHNTWHERRVSFIHLNRTIFSSFILLKISEIIVPLQCSHRKMQRHWKRVPGDIKCIL